MSAPVNLGQSNSNQARETKQNQIEKSLMALNDAVCSLENLCDSVCGCVDTAVSVLNAKDPNPTGLSYFLSDLPDVIMCLKQRVCDVNSRLENGLF